MSQEPSKDFVRQCMGRFCVDLPSSMARVSDTFQVRYVELEERLWEKPDDEARKHVWEQRLARIAALKEQRELPDDAQGTIREQRAFESVGVRGVLFHRYDQPEVSTWGGLMGRGPVDVWMQIDGDLDREPEWAKRLTEVAAGYQLRDAKEPLPARGKDWFYLRHGVIALPTKEMEEAKSRFEGHPLGLKLKFSTETVAEVQRQGLMEKLSNTMGMVAAHWAGTRTWSRSAPGAGRWRGCPERSSSSAPARRSGRSCASCGATRARRTRAPIPSSPSSWRPASTRRTRRWRSGMRCWTRCAPWGSEPGF
ncbi:hypothetical protein OV427_34625 [Pyxidicoccus sp. MSG2]|nr:hypothetical protein [Pyxidicoccus sp. MSG2]MCY1020944.1 hypothetical protein [Pyxidicoccus sp. MSG2]